VSRSISRPVTLRIMPYGADTGRRPSPRPARVSVL
jgi:hypothetical protein